MKSVPCADDCCVRLKFKVLCSRSSDLPMLKGLIWPVLAVTDTDQVMIMPCPFHFRASFKEAVLLILKIKSALWIVDQQMIESSAYSIHRMLFIVGTNSTASFTGAWGWKGWAFLVLDECLSKVQLFILIRGLGDIRLQPNTAATLHSW